MAEAGISFLQVKRDRIMLASLDFAFAQKRLKLVPALMEDAEYVIDVAAAARLLGDRQAERAELVPVAPAIRRRASVQPSSWRSFTRRIAP